MPTRRGRAVLGAALACFFLGRTLGVSELYAVALTAGLVVGLASLSVRWARYRLGFARRIHPARAFPDDTVRVDLTVRNVGRIASPPLLVEDEIPDPLGGPARYAVESIPPDRLRSFAVDRHARARGKYTLGPLLVRLVDPFGLAEISTTNDREDHLIVFPRIEMLSRATPPSQRGGTGPAKAMRLAPEGEEFYAVREYEDGDDLRKIHWASVARTGDLMIRQEEARLHPRATILLDTRAEPHRGTGTHSSLEWSISAAASAIWHLGRAGFSLRLATEAAGPASPRSGRLGVEALLEILAGIKPTRRAVLSPAIRKLGARPTAGGALVVVMPPPPAPELLPLARLRRVYAWCGAILVDAESFTTIAPKARAAADQRLAESETALARAGWRIATAGSTDRIGDAWTSLLAGPASRRNSASSRL